MRKALFTVVIVVLSVSVAFASDARQAALGLGGKYVHDVNDIIYFPALAINYTNVCQVDLGFYSTPPSGQWALFNVGLGDYLAVGGALRREDGRAFDIANDMGYTPPNPGLNLWAAYDPGYIKFGLGFYHAGYKETEDDENDTTEYVYSISTMAFTGSGAMAIGDGSAELGFHLGMNGASDEFTYADGTTETEESEGGTEIGVMARVFLPLWDLFELVPVVSYNSFNYTQVVNDTSLDEYADMTIGVGCAANFEVMDDGFISAGFGFNTYSESVDDSSGTALYEDKTTTFPEITLCTEVPATDWLKLRAGVTKQFATNTHDEGGEETTTKLGENDFVFLNIGAGVEVGNFTFDFTIDEGNIFQGPYIVSGITDPFTLKASATFDW